jgi:N-acetylneuraminic acid mutarotase
MKYFCYLASPVYLLSFIVSIVFTSCIDDLTYSQIEQENCIGEYNDLVQQTYTITPDFSTDSLNYRISVSGDRFSEKALGEILSTDDGSIQEISNKEIFFTPDANAKPPYKFYICKSGSHIISIGRWNKITDSLFIMPAKGAKMVVNGKQLYIYGGFDGESYRRDLHRYDLAAGSSTVLNTFHPARAYHAMSFNNNKLYVYGGHDGTIKHNDTRIYDIATNTWTNANPLQSPDFGRYYVAASASSTDMYVIGGYADTANPPIAENTNEIWRYNYSGNSWTLLDSNGPVRRHHAVVQAGDSIYLFGGYDSVLSGQLWQFSIASKIWTQIGDLSSISGTNGARFDPAFFYYNNALYVFGGLTANGYVNDLYKFDLNTQQWVVMESGATPRYQPVFAALDNYGLIVGLGRNYDGTTPVYLNDLWIYDPKGD